MAANGRDIPGFYYDTEKRKYFKIEKNHVAVPSSRYSQQSVKGLREESRKRKRAHDERQTRQTQTLRRSKALQHPLAAGTAVHRELGTRSISGLFSTRSDAITQSFHPKLRVDLQRRRALGLSNPQVSCFDRDAATGGLLIGVSDRLNQGTVMALTPLTDSSSDDNTLRARPRRDQDVGAIMAVKSDISSVNIAPSRSVVITSQGNSTPPIVHLTRLLDPAEAGSDCMPADSGMSMQFRHPDVSTIWCSAPNPFDSSGHDQIAIGTQASVVAIHGSGHWQIHPAMRTHSDVLALGWTGPHTLAAGLRSAEVRLWDSRSNGSTLRLRHRGAVTSLKSAGNASQIVVDGLRSSLCMYDLRMVKPPQKSRQPSVALLEFAAEGHDEVVRTGFDVDPELGVVVAAGDKSSLAAYSMRSGKKIGLWKMPLDSSADDTGSDGAGTVKCARFGETQHGSPSIMASYNSRITEFAW